MLEADITEDEDVDVDDARGVADRIRGAPEFGFDGLGEAEEFEGIASGVIQVDRGVEEAGRSGRAFLRGGIVEGGC